MDHPERSDPGQLLRDAARTLEKAAARLDAEDTSREEVDLAVAAVRRAQFQRFGPRPPARSGKGGKWKMLDYLTERLGQPVYREELAAVADIDDWARRIRELRVEHGYDVEHVGRGRYVLHAAEPDEDKATSWKTANSIRRRSGSVKSKVDAFFRANVGRLVRRDQLDYVAGKKKEATRRARELRELAGWPILSHIDEPTLRPSEYMLLSDDPMDFGDPNQREYPAETRAAVFRRDEYRCQNCGQTREDALKAGDTRFFLEVDHVIPVADPAELSDEEKADPTNLQTLCHRCHAKKTGRFQEAQRARRRTRQQFSG